MKTNARHDDRLMTQLIKGAIAGAAATWVMGKATTWMYEQESQRVRDQENAARHGKTAYAVAAEKAGAASGVELSDDQEKRAGAAIHWTLGIAAGAAYAVMRRRWPQTAAMKGLPFGAGFFLVMDEFMNAALGFTPGPAAFPWQAHARGLGGHLVFGAVSEAVMEKLDRVA